jgi:hypothetical protein
MYLIPVYILSVIGFIWIWFKIIWPIIEAYLFGLIYTIFMCVLGGWESLHPKHWWFIFRWPFVKMWDRLSGDDAYVTEITIGGYTWTPLFRFHKA